MKRGVRGGEMAGRLTENDDIEDQDNESNNPTAGPKLPRILLRDGKRRFGDRGGEGRGPEEGLHEQRREGCEHHGCLIVVCLALSRISELSVTFECLGGVKIEVEEEARMVLSQLPADASAKRKRAAAPGGIFSGDDLVTWGLADYTALGMAAHVPSRCSPELVMCR